jgi:SPX domain protein involved in polyphosphate accumulation
MHFGKTFESRKLARFNEGYLDYQFLKRRLKEICAAYEASAATGSPSAAERQFQQAIAEWLACLEAELHKVTAAILCPPLFCFVRSICF